MEGEDTRPEPGADMPTSTTGGPVEHGWDVSVEEAIALQRRLRGLVQQRNGFELEQVRTVAGVDASYKDEVGRAAVVVCSFPDLTVLDQATATRTNVFPYVPGLLSFREMPQVLDALATLRVQPDVLMVDGQGYAHPRRFGIASHLGVYLDRPAIGIAKSRLVGTYTEPGPAVGDFTPLIDRGATIGAVLRTKPKTNPLFISVGHKIDLPTAIAVVLRCLRGYRLPETTRLADRLAGTAGSGDPGPLLGRV
jgi:deoxyribonuclease V